jgi:hypothetical protein
VLQEISINNQPSPFEVQMKKYDNPINQSKVSVFTPMKNNADNDQKNK